MPKFNLNLKKLDVPLFGMVDGEDQGPWLAEFAKTTGHVPVTIDAAALDFVADELAVDGDGLMVAAERYVQGRFREKADGLGGSELGDFGEVLALLLNRAAKGREIVRVVGWRPPPGKPSAKGRFPQPDFVVREAGRQFALEVKSTEALDYRKLLRVGSWTLLKPCGAVARCREAALDQIGYSGQASGQPGHLLKLRDGNVVPFPVDEGQAVAVLALDGRTKALRSDGRFRTPKPCRAANPPRGCWTCVAQDHHAVVVSMRNAPGSLPLAGTGGDDEGAWLRSYARWTHALSSRESRAVQAATVALAGRVREWRGRAFPDESGAMVGAFWGSYLVDVLRRHGFEANTGLRTLSEEMPEYGWSPEEVGEPISREASMADLQRAAPEFLSDGGPMRYSIVDTGGGGSRETLSVDVGAGTVTFNLVPDTWWADERVGSRQAAAGIAGRLLKMALRAAGAEEEARGLEPPPLRAATATVGGVEVAFGWLAAPAKLDPDGWWRSFPRSGWPWRFHPMRWPIWPFLLAMGDPRARLRVHLDGRADLRFPREGWIA